jgi:hypothetical protein
MFAVFDKENEQAFGPYDSEAEAEADILAKATKNGWPEILEAATHSGWLSDGSTATPGRFGSIGLELIELQPKEV